MIPSFDQVCLQSHTVIAGTLLGFCIGLLAFGLRRPLANGGVPCCTRCTQMLLGMARLVWPIAS